MRAVLDVYPVVVVVTYVQVAELAQCRIRECDAFVCVVDYRTAVECYIYRVGYLDSDQSVVARRCIREQAVMDVAQVNSVPAVVT